MCLTNNEKLAKKMRILRDHGMNPSKRYWYDVIGYNYRMTNIQAAIGVAQIKKIEQFIAKKRRIAVWYSEGLKKLEQGGLIKLHPEMPWARCVYWMYSVLVNDGSKLGRDGLATALAEAGIETRPFFYPVHIMPPYKTKQQFEVAEELSKKGINLPSAVTLTREDVQEVVDKVGTFVKEGL